MNTLWHYLHNNTIRGPYTTDEIKDHAVRDLLGANDLLWPVGEEQRKGIRAMCAINFAQLQQDRLQNVPDWLSDVAATQEFGPIAARWTPQELPDWIDDVLLGEGLGKLSTPAKLPAPEPAKAKVPPIPKPLPEAPAPLDKENTPPVVAPPLAPNAIPPTWSPPPPPPPPSVVVPPPISAALSPPPPPAVRPVSVPPPPMTPKPPPVAPNIVPPSSSPPSPSGTVDKTTRLPRSSPPAAIPATVAERREPSPPRVAMSLDPLVRQPQVETIFEVLWKAKAAISRWADLDEVRDLLVKGDAATVRASPSLQEALVPYEKYGKAVAEKLWQFVDSTVQNRRVYYLALASKA